MDSTSISEQAVIDIESSACQHHWVIDRPAGPVSRGVCRLCSEEKEFRNYIEGSAWGSGSDVSLEQLSGASRIPAGISVPQPGVAFDEDA